MPAMAIADPSSRFVAERHLWRRPLSAHYVLSTPFERLPDPLFNQLKRLF